MIFLIKWRCSLVMIKILIVDDERRTRESLKNFISWNDLGVGIVKTAPNGIAALEIVKTIQPDIVLCDVCMPKMNGIEFAVELRKIYPKCSLIFISGYSDKEYLKSAILLKAVNYIEKPFELCELESILRETISSIEAEQRNEMKSQILQNSIEVSIPLVREEIVLDLVSRKVKASELSKKYAKLYYDFSDNKVFTALSIILNWNSSVDMMTRENYKSAIRQLFCDKIFGDNMTILAGVRSVNRVILITNKDFSVEIESSNSILTSIQDELMSLLSNLCDISICVGTSVANLEFIDKSYENAESLGSRQFYEGTNKIFTNLSNDSRPVFLNAESVIDSLKNILLSFDKLLVFDFINNLFIDLLKNEYINIIDVKIMLFKLFIQIVECQNNNIIKLEDSINDKDDLTKRFLEAVTLRQISDCILQKIQDVMTMLEEKRAMTRKIYEAKIYIHNNYSLNNLSISFIAKSLFLSVNYLSSLFKKQTGMTINTYITNYRIDKAKILLLDNSIKLYDVAFRVGFTDPDYFAKLFKKHEGITLSDFREKN